MYDYKMRPVILTYLLDVLSALMQKEPKKSRLLKNKQNLRRILPRKQARGLRLNP